MFDAAFTFEKACPILAFQLPVARLVLGELLQQQYLQKSELKDIASQVLESLRTDPGHVIDGRLIPLLQEYVIIASQRGDVAGALASARCLYVLTRRRGHGWLFFLNILIDAHIFPDPIAVHAPAPNKKPSIPRQIIQYWDAPEPPADVAAMIATWQAVPDFNHKLVDHKEARDFLVQQYGPRITTAYDAAIHVAAKADIFRLAWLYQHGGLYVDADEKLVGKLNSLIAPDCRILLTWAQGIPPCIQNGFILAEPCNPLIAAALMLAVKRVEHTQQTGIMQKAWIQTGPGVITMAVLDDFAIHGKPVAAAGLQLMRDPVHRTVVQSDEFLEYRQHAHGNWRLS
jgi:hypothetical protein